MVIQMLEAVSEMLNLSLEERRESINTNVKCAKLMLDKIIEGMRPLNIESLEPITSITPKLKVSPQKRPKDKVEIIADDHPMGGKMIKDIKGMEPGEMMEIDDGGGWVKMSWEKAIGKKFISGRVL